jgi:hypothetical protein
MKIKELHRILTAAIEAGQSDATVKICTMNAYANVDTAAFLYVHGSKEKEFVIEADEKPFTT